MPRTCTTNIHGSSVFYVDPSTQEVTAMTRGTVLPVDVDRLLALPYGATPPTAEEILHGELPGSYQFAIGEQDFLVHVHSGTPTSPNTKYPRTAPDQLLGELRLHQPSRSQAETLHKVNRLRQRLDTVAAALGPATAEERELYASTGIDDFRNAPGASAMAELLDEIETLSWRSSHELRVPLQLDDDNPDDLLARYAPTPAQELQREARSILAARRFELPTAAEALAIANTPRQPMLEIEEVLDHHDVVLPGAPFAVHVYTSIYNDEYFVPHDSVLDSVWATEDDALDRQRAIEIANYVDNVSAEGAEIRVEVYPWAAGERVVWRRSARPVPQENITTSFEHAAAYVVYQDSAGSTDHSPMLDRSPTALFATLAEASEFAASCGVYEPDALAQHLSQDADDLIRAAERFDHGPLPQLTTAIYTRGTVLAHTATGTAGAYLEDPTGTPGDPGMRFFTPLTLAGLPRAVVVAMPLSPDLPTADHSTGPPPTR